jgi:hypothetical protein
MTNLVTGEALVEFSQNSTSQFDKMLSYCQKPSMSKLTSAVLFDGIPCICGLRSKTLSADFRKGLKIKL